MVPVQSVFVINDGKPLIHFVTLKQNKHCLVKTNTQRGNDMCVREGKGVLKAKPAFSLVEVRILRDYLFTVTVLVLFFGKLHTCSWQPRSRSSG